MATPFRKKSLERTYENINMSALAGPDPPRLAGRTGRGEFGPVWLEMVGWWVVLAWPKS